MSESQLETIKAKLGEILDLERDSVYIYCMPERKYIRKEVIGQEKALTEAII